jgi:hypothetical protein
MSCGHCFRKVPCKEKLEGKDWCEGCVAGTKYITYPESKEYYNSGAFFRTKPETIPSLPPWTTWNGVLQCEKESRVGKWLMDMDPHYQEITTVDKVYVKGLWTASKSPPEYCVKL